ncbi:odorant receptor Or2-like [Odontomachus brunneus]|uniref:odorant receptor Or2-like n=1 Tax=Odontomachus brunneus TaxID=486640 RepID=UPI0013F25E64|nr:odorant receptor Or2-like [Odontomachus brunneus]
MRENNRKSGNFSLMVTDSALLILNIDYSNGYNDLKWAIGLNRLMLKIVGLWPPDIRDEREIVRSKLRLLGNCIALFFVLTIPVLVSLVRVWGDMILMIDNLQHSLPLLITIFKVSILWYKQEVLVPLIDMIAKDWIKAKMKEERNVMLSRARITRTIAMCGMFTILLAVIITSVFPCFGLMIRHVTNLTDPGKPLPIQSYYLHDVSKSPQYELTFIAQGIATFTSGLSYTAIDNFLGLLVLHVCGQLENLQSRLTHMKICANFDAALKYNIQDHIRLIRSIQIIDDTFNLMLLGIVLYFGILFCLQGFLIVNVINQKGQLSFAQLSWFVAAIICGLLHMCLYCAVGECLVTQSESIHRATYKCAWYTIESKTARNLTLIMLRANKPLYITAGKTFPMTMATFCNLLKTSAGYISVLLANQN